MIHVFVIAFFYFNPRTPAKECDLFISPYSCVNAAFQSTHPREGVRLGFAWSNTSWLLFQSTHPREGVRLLFDHLKLLVGSISIHAPPRRSATHRRKRSDFRPIISIHAPPRRSATSTNGARFRAFIFQSTHPREGVRRWSGCFSGCQSLFQSTHPREGVRRRDTR